MKAQSESVPRECTGSSGPARRQGRDRIASGKPSLITEPADARASEPLLESATACRRIRTKIRSRYRCRTVHLAAGAGDATARSPVRATRPAARSAQSARKEEALQRRSFEGQTSMVSPARATAAEWIKRFRKLRSEGKLEQVTKELAEFRKTFPAYVLPDDLKASARRSDRPRSGTVALRPRAARGRTVALTPRGTALVAREPPRVRRPSTANSATSGSRRLPTCERKQQLLDRRRQGPPSRHPRAGQPQRPRARRADSPQRHDANRLRRDRQPEVA
jgi:hypothetical protein